MNELALLYITTPSKEVAQQIASHLLEHKLIACGNSYPIESIYRWKGSVTQEVEYVLLLKTTPSLVEQVKTEVSAIHPYDTPCILHIPAEANLKYFQWVQNEVKENL